MLPLRNPATPPIPNAPKIPAMAKLLEARQQLANLMSDMDGKVAAEAQIKKLLADPDLMAALKQRSQEQGPKEGTSSEGSVDG